jgi:hypothetical protein
MPRVSAEEFEGPIACGTVGGDGCDDAVGRVSRALGRRVRVARKGKESIWHEQAE